MSDQGRLSIWKGDPAMDSWYNAAVHRNATIRSNSKGDMEEMLFFDIAKSNQVKYPSGAANDWFYGATTGGNDTIESKLNFTQMCLTAYLTQPSAYSSNYYNFTYIEW
jgi:hypothetical protein